MRRDLTTSPGSPLPLFIGQPWRYYTTLRIAKSQLLAIRDEFRAEITQRALEGGCTLQVTKTTELFTNELESVQVLDANFDKKAVFWIKEVKMGRMAVEEIGGVDQDKLDEELWRAEGEEMNKENEMIDRWEVIMKDRERLKMEDEGGEKTDVQLEQMAIVDQEETSYKQDGLVGGGNVSNAEEMEVANETEEQEEYVDDVETAGIVWIGGEFSFKVEG